jgi:hypothetical protein
MLVLDVPFVSGAAEFLDAGWLAGWTDEWRAIRVTNDTTRQTNPESDASRAGWGNRRHRGYSPLVLYSNYHRLHRADISYEHCSK